MMEKRGYPERLFAHLPRSHSRLYDLPRKQARSNPWFVAPYYLADKLDMQGYQRRLSWPGIQLFDRWVVPNMTVCNMFHGLSPFGL